jgi:hypothetical protein
MAAAAPPVVLTEPGVEDSAICAEGEAADAVVAALFTGSGAALDVAGVAAGTVLLLDVVAVVWMFEVCWSMLLGAGDAAGAGAAAAD